MLSRLFSDALQGGLLSSQKEQKPVYQGLLTPGNIDLNNRPKVQSTKDKYSTVYTMTIEQDGKTILLPRVVEGKIISPKEAIDYFHKTGQHLGVFKSREDADSYDKQMHQDNGWSSQNNKWPGLLD